MVTNSTTAEEIECEWEGCDRTFDSENGMKIHHNRTHGESISGVLRECSHCGTQIRRDRSRNGHEVFCSDECHRRFNRVRVVCANCDDEAWKRPSDLIDYGSGSDHDNQFCDRECYQEWRSENIETIGENISDSQRKHDRITATCENCNATVERPRPEIERVNQVFCSRECLADAKYIGEDYADTDGTGGGSPRVKRVVVDCDTCGTTVERRPSQLRGCSNTYCSDECKHAGRMVDRIDYACDHCGKDMQLLPSKLKECASHYCSTECKYSAMRNSVTVSCAWCDDTKVVAASRADRIDNHFCDPKCQRAYYTEVSAPTEVDRIEVSCAQCGDPLSLRPRQVDRYEHHFCDTECHGGWRSEHITGEDHPSWRRIEVDCHWCGEQLLRKPSQVDRAIDNRQFCDMECLSDWQSWANVSPDDPVPDITVPRYEWGDSQSDSISDIRDRVLNSTGEN